MPRAVYCLRILRLFFATLRHENSCVASHSERVAMSYSIEIARGEFKRNVNAVGKKNWQTNGKGRKTAFRHGRGGAICRPRS